MDNQRLFDLVRHQRGELFTAELITKDEYAELAMAHSAVARLEDYDTTRAEAAMLREAASALIRKLVAMHQSDSYVSVWVLYQTHGGVYQGPDYTRELAALNEAISGSSVEWLERHDAGKGEEIAKLKNEVETLRWAIGVKDKQLSEFFDAISDNGKAALARAEKAEAEQDEGWEMYRTSLSDIESALGLDNTGSIGSGIVQAIKGLQAERDGLAKALADEERTHLQTINSRDAATDAFTVLAAIFDVETEFSNLRDYEDIENDCVDALARIKAEARRKALLEAAGRARGNRAGKQFALDYLELEAMAQEADHA